MKNKFSQVLILLMTVFAAQAQTDTIAPLVLTYEQAQQLVVENNLELVAAKYDIKIAEAQLKQARQWRNPLFAWNADLYSLELNQFLNYRNQKLIQIEQVISISGKHRNEVRLAKVNIELAKLQVNDVMRGLLYECAIQYTELQSKQEQQVLLESSIKRMEELLAFAQEQFTKGNLSGNELTRLKTELLSLRTEQQQNKISIEENSAALRIVLALPEFVPIQTVARERKLNAGIALPSIIEMAKAMRPDYQLRKKSIEYEEQNLKLQKSNAVPDFNFGYQPHDKGSNYVRPYSGIVFEMSIPLFDRNQGGIQEAKYRIKQAESNLKIIDLEIEQELSSGYQKFLLHLEGLNRYSPDLIQELEEFNTRSINSYNNRLINILEYIDQQRIYIQTKSQQIDLMNSYLQSVNELNFKVGNKILD
jgi:cobalt-zinc-cadmium efflux system outer membrane protein